MDNQVAINDGAGMSKEPRRSVRLAPPASSALPLPSVEKVDEKPSQADAVSNYTAVTTPKIRTWMNELPIRPSEYAPAVTKPAYTVEHYRDLLAWIMNDAQAIFRNLNALEKRYRDVGLRYHAAPYKLRHGKNRLARVALHPMVFTRMAELFEADATREQQEFFAPWRLATNAARGVVEAARRSKDEMILAVLCATYARCEGHIRAACTALTDINRSIDGVERMMDRMQSQVSVPSRLVADLKGRFGREATLFRKWVATFPEVAAGRVKLEDMASAMASFQTKRQES